MKDKFNFLVNEGQGWREALTVAHRLKDRLNEKLNEAGEKIKKLEQVAAIVHDAYMRDPNFRTEWVEENSFMNRPHKPRDTSLVEEAVGVSKELTRLRERLDVIEAEYRELKDRYLPPVHREDVRIHGDTQPCDMGR
jgi:hypothetical protein